MRAPDEAILQGALEFAGMFGFLTRDIFFEHLCPRSRSRKYANWNALVREGLFQNSKTSKNVLYLSPKGLNHAGGRSVRKRVHYFIGHDSLVAQIWFSLREFGGVRRSWTEAQLRDSPSDALNILGGKNIEKLPDLVVDLATPHRTVRIAIEVEATRKSRERYDQIALAYTRLSAIDLIFFFCEDAALEYQVTKAFRGSVFREVGKIPVTVLLDDFLKNRLRSVATVDNRKFGLDTFIARVIESARNQDQTGRDGTETGVSLRPIGNGTAA